MLRVTQLLLFTLIGTSLSIILYTEKSSIYNDNEKTYEFSLKEFVKQNGDAVLGSIIFISVHNSNESLTKLKILSNLNSKPTLKSYEHADMNGINGIYSISLSPCELNYGNDILYIKIMADKKAIISFKIDITTLDNSIFEPICCLGQKEKISKNLYLPGVVQTSKGIIKFGGKDLSKNKTSNELFLLTQNKTWEKIELPITQEQPSPRYGMGIASFDLGSYFLMYGGKNAQDKIENDLWVFDIENKKWHLIGKSQDIINFPINSFLPTLSLIENKGIILSFGSTDLQNDNIYTIDIYLLKQIIFSDNKNLITNYLSNFIKVYPTKGTILLRYGHSIDHINDDEIMIFGGYDTKTNKVVDNCDIINLEKLSDIEKAISSCKKNIMPNPRAFHTTIKYGPTLLLYGGEKSANEIFGDIYKYITSSKSWIKLDLHEEDDFLKLPRAKILYNYLEGSDSDKPIIIGSDNDFILGLNFIRCENRAEIFSDKFCLPCSFGYILVKSKCTPCRVGQYFEYEKDNYFASSCQSCPSGTFSNKQGGIGMSGCLLCPYGTFNDEYGKEKCKKCPEDEICLIGSTSPINYQDIEVYDIENSEAYLRYENYPEFIDRKQVFKRATLTAGVTLILFLTFILSFIIFICYCCRKKKTLICLSNIDFIPLTGGNEKKSNGGLITIIYSILICSLGTSFILRFLFWNDIVEVSSLDLSKSTTRKELKSSIIIELDVFGEYLPCTKENMIHHKKNTNINGTSELSFSECSPDIIFGKNMNYSYFHNKKQAFFTCMSINEHQCRIHFEHENCEPELKNLNSLNFYFKNNKTYISLYKWIFKNYWDTTLHNANNIKKPGYSIVEGIFKANDDITKTKYVFKGDKTPAVISLSLSPLYYSIDSGDNFSGHRISFLTYQRNELQNEYSFNFDGTGVKLDFEFTVSQNSNIVSVKKDISLLDFFAFMLGILAGFAFLSRVTKHILEKCNCLNYTSNQFEFVELQEVNDNNKFNIEMAQKNDENQK